ncbi:MAG TPA: hypothetical protein VM802_10995 [Chitinophaga sp.]|uniref:hypothetical protein n=1 Tax=Chitinophaga sp. TaxID=1869181 RepID=UPI002BC9644D|nr:hypothetical protein [Chitinophaga sp.]HVI45392.1 hypothetical protein [Chitinophaga sp.]
MANQHTLTNSAAEFSIRHRAICEDGDFKGPWRANIDQAYDDADRHQQEHNDHIVRVVTEQSLSMVYSK